MALAKEYDETLNCKHINESEILVNVWQFELKKHILILKGYTFLVNII